ncbi:hypothetical protein K3757_05805 [Sulfitobacter sp. S223]|uniref:hypothetical protein n=1 Tax=Sulfitobacter sp. S223 TaxID=2867023 RepID=UPI0021A4F7B7|nr:hypothetical protein [Sulfitobacter sp. S223]UWR27451.1 hypothetical protein K3757_05805 [Sulfitobacter sp. S223]
MTRAFFPAVLCAGLSLLGACTQFPALDRTITPALEAADYPTLVPMGPVLASAEATGVEPVQATATMNARVAALKARAARLRGSVLSGAERQRLAKGLH